MSQDDVMDLAGSFDPMEDDFWSPWQAFAWIRHRDVKKVRDCSEYWRMICPAEDRKDIWRDFWSDTSRDYEANRAWNNKFRGALVSGKVRATGESNGTRRYIDALQWLDLRLYQIRCEPSGLVSRVQLGERSVILEWLDPQFAESAPSAKDGPQFYHKNKRFDGPTLPEPDFRDVLVSVADMTKEFPPEVVDSASVPPKPIVNAILLKNFLKKTANRELTKQDLREQAEKEFPGHRVTDRLFGKAYSALPAEQRRRRGETARTLARHNGAKG
jgi:hypothetical protein